MLQICYKKAIQNIIFIHFPLHVIQKSPKQPLFHLCLFAGKEETGVNTAEKFGEMGGLGS